MPSSAGSWDVLPGRWLLLVALLGTASDLKAQDAGPATSPAAVLITSSGSENNGSLFEAGLHSIEEKTLERVLSEAVEDYQESARPYELSGYLSLSYRGRKVGGRNDEDFYGYLSVEGGRSEVDDATFHVFGRATLDVDGDSGGSGNIFSSLNDLGGDSLDLHLYEAFVDLRRSLAPESLGLEKIRLGRQNLNVGYTYLLDGVRLDFRRIQELGQLAISVFGGVPQFLYESSRSGDWLIGLDLTIHPLEATWLEMRYAHVQDRARYLGGTERDDFASLTLRQVVVEGLNLTAEWRTLDADTRDASLRLAWDLPDADLIVYATYRYQASLQSQYSTEYDPYLVVLGPSFAYHQVDLQASKMLGKEFGLDGGLTVRQLQNEDREGPFNREYWRAWLTLSAYRWVRPDLDLAVTGELWDGQEDEAASAGFEATWRAEEELRFSLGSFYSLFKYDLFLVDERQDATTFFLKARWKFQTDFRLDGRYEYETGDEGDFHSLWLGLTWTF